MKILPTLLASVGVIALASCGGGGGSTPTPAVGVTPPPPPPPPPPSGSDKSTAVGPISGFGSVIVNGVRYNTDSASFDIDGSPGSQSDLSVGQIVIVKSTTDASGQAVAENIIFEDIVEGPIDAIDIAANRLEILRQNVFIDGSTSFDDSISPRNINGLSVGDIVEVSGQFNANNDIVASRIEPKPAGGEFELHGTISNLNSAATTFNLNALTVGYASATLDDFGTNGPQNGDHVEVKGNNFNNAGDFLATKVEFKGGDMGVGDPDDSGEIHGFVTAFTSATNFEVAGIPVTTNSSTEYIFGTSADLALNVMVEAEGNFNSDGVLVADKIKFENERNIRITSTLDSVDSTANTLTIFGVTFSADTSTRFEDKSDAEVSPFNLGNLSAGDYLEVRGFERASDGLYAARVEREDADDEDEVQAFVEVVSTDSLEMLGITINTNSNTEYEDENDLPLTRAQFFARVVPGDLVKADGDKTGSSSLLAEELSFEVEDD